MKHEAWSRLALADGWLMMAMDGQHAAQGYPRCLLGQLPLGFRIPCLGLGVPGWVVSGCISFLVMSCQWSALGIHLRSVVGVAEAAPTWLPAMSIYPLL